MYEIVTSKRFDKELKKLLSSKRLSKEQIGRIFLILMDNPFNTKLRTHKVNSRTYGLKYSSRIDGDLRIIWDFNENQKLILVLFDIGGHEGSKGVY